MSYSIFSLPEAEERFIVIASDTEIQCFAGMVGWHYNSNAATCDLRRKTRNVTMQAAPWAMRERE